MYKPIGPFGPIGPRRFRRPPKRTRRTPEVSAGSPITSTGLSAAVLSAAGGPVIACENVGLLCSAGEDVRGLSYGYDFALPNLPPLQFSVVKGSRGITGTAVRAEAGVRLPSLKPMCLKPRQAGTNEQDLDGNGSACSTNVGLA
ncbi:MAG: hypothetical protein U0559_10650 [Anaerolineae bacterium]